MVLQLGVFNGNLAENSVGEGRAAIGWHFLADYVGHALGEEPVDFLLRQIAAVTVISAADGLVLDFFEPFLGAEAAVSLALFNQLFGVGKVHILALALNIRTVVAADVGTFVVLKPCELQRVVYKVHRALNKAFAVGVLNSQNKFSALRFRHKVLIQSGSQVSHMHKAGRARSVSCSDGFFCHKITLLIKILYQIIIA